MSDPVQVICICPSIGFPSGPATANRILYIGQSFVEGGIPFTVWHYGLSPTKFNTHVKGEINGIRYEYLSGKSFSTGNRLTRNLWNLKGILVLFYRLLFKLAFKKNVRLYLFLHGHFLNSIIPVVSRLVNIRVIQEINEWWPDIRSKMSDRIAYKSTMFKWSNGAIVISDYIQKKIENKRKDADFKTIRIPVLAEPGITVNGYTKNNGLPYLFWCGSVNAYQEDVEFLLRGFAKLLHQHPEQVTLKLIIAGGINESVKKKFVDLGEELNLDAGNVLFKGFVSDEELHALIHHAQIQLLPLWNDERSKTRFPTKMASYAFSGRPVLAGKVGEIVPLFTDSLNIKYYEPGNLDDFVSALNTLLKKPEMADQIGKNAMEVAKANFDYRVYAV